MTKSSKSKKVVKAWLVVRGDSEIAALNSDWDYSLSVFDKEGPAKERADIMVDLQARVIPCTISYILPQLTKKG